MTLKEKLKLLRHGRYSFYFLLPDMSFGLYFTQYDGYWCSLNLWLFSIEVYLDQI